MAVAVAVTRRGAVVPGSWSRHRRGGKRMRRLLVSVTAVLLLIGGVSSRFVSQVSGKGFSGAAASQKTAAPAPDRLDQLLAPVALYPDSLLAQMLLRSGNPGKVAALHEWLASNQSLKG